MYIYILFNKVTLKKNKKKYFLKSNFFGKFHFSKNKHFAKIKSEISTALFGFLNSEKIEKNVKIFIFLAA